MVHSKSSTTARPVYFMKRHVPPAVINCRVEMKLGAGAMCMQSLLTSSKLEEQSEKMSIAHNVATLYSMSEPMNASSSLAGGHKPCSGEAK